MYAPNNRAESRFLERQREMRKDLGTLPSGPAPFRNRNQPIYKWPNTPQILEWAAGATSTTRITNLSTESLSRLGRGGLTPLFHPAARAASRSSGYAMEIDDDGNETASLTTLSGPGSTRIPLSQRGRRPLSSRATRGPRATLWPQVEDEIKRLQADFEHDLRVTRIHFSNHYDFMELGLHNLSKQVGGLQRVLEQNLERAERADPRERDGTGGIGVRKRRGDRAFDWPAETETQRKRRELSPEDGETETETGSGSGTTRSMSDTPAPRRGGIGEEQGELSKNEAMNRMIRRAAENLRQKAVRETQREVREAFLSVRNMNTKEMGTQTLEPSRSPSPEVLAMPGGYPKSVSSVAVGEKEDEGKRTKRVREYGPDGERKRVDVGERLHDLAGRYQSRAQQMNPFRGDDEEDSTATALSGTENNVLQIAVQPPSPPKMAHDSMDYYKMHLEAAELREEMHQGLEPEWYDASVSYPQLRVESTTPLGTGNDDDDRLMMSGGLGPTYQGEEQVEAEQAAPIAQLDPEPEHKEEDVVSVEIPALRQVAPLEPLPTAETVTVSKTRTVSNKKPEVKGASHDKVLKHYETLREHLRSFPDCEAINLGPCNKNLNSTSLGSREFPFASTFPTSKSPDLVEGTPSPLPSVDPQAWNEYSITLRGHIIMAGIHQILWDTILAVDDETIRSLYSSHWDVYSFKVINWIYYSLRPVWNQWVFLSEDNGDEAIGNIKTEIMYMVEEAAWLRHSIVEDEVHADYPRYRPSFMLMVPDVETTMKMETDRVWKNFFIHKGDVEDIEVTFSENTSSISGTSSWTEPNLITGNYDFTFMYPALMEGRLDISTGLVDNREVIGKGWVLYKTKTAGENREYESHTEAGEDDWVREQEEDLIRRSRSQKKEGRGKGKEKAQPPGKDRGREGKSVSPSPYRGAENYGKDEGLKSNLATRRGHSPSPIGNREHNVEDNFYRPLGQGPSKKERKTVSWAEEVEEEGDTIQYKEGRAKSKSKSKGKGKPGEEHEKPREIQKGRKERERKEREEALQKKKATESYQFIKRDMRKDQKLKSNRPHSEVAAEKAARAQKKKEKMRRNMKEKEGKGGEGPGFVPVLHSLEE